MDSSTQSQLPGDPPDGRVEDQDDSSPGRLPPLKGNEIQHILHWLNCVRRIAKYEHDRELAAAPRPVPYECQGRIDHWRATGRSTRWLQSLISDTREG